MKATIIRWISKEEVVLAPYAAGAGLALALYADTVLAVAHPSGQLDVGLVMIATFAVKAAIVYLQKRAGVTVKG